MLDVWCVAQVAKLEADSAIAALKALSDLSVELKSGCCNVEDPSCRRALVGAQTLTAAEGEWRRPPRLGLWCRVLCSLLQALSGAVLLLSCVRWCAPCICQASGS